MNNICIKEDNTKTFNAIIQVSQMIKYENSFLFSAIQRKNRFLDPVDYFGGIFAVEERETFLGLQVRLGVGERFEVVYAVE